jgi:hypothetical protein
MSGNSDPKNEKAIKILYLILVNIMTPKIIKQDIKKSILEFIG